MPGLDWQTLSSCWRIAAYSTVAFWVRNLWIGSGTIIVKRTVWVASPFTFFPFVAWTQLFFLSLVSTKVPWRARLPNSILSLNKTVAKLNLEAVPQYQCLSHKTYQATACAEMNLAEKPRVKASFSKEGYSLAQFKKGFLKTWEKIWPCWSKLHIHRRKLLLEERWGQYFKSHGNHFLWHKEWPLFLSAVSLNEQSLSFGITTLHSRTATGASMRGTFLPMLEEKL